MGVLLEKVSLFESAREKQCARKSERDSVCECVRVQERESIGDRREREYLSILVTTAEATARAFQRKLQFSHKQQ